MTQFFAAEFGEFKNALKDFSTWLKTLENEENLREEIIQVKMSKLIGSIEVQLEFYSQMDYKAKFIEWVQRGIVKIINKHKRLSKEKKKYLINAVRVNLKNKFESVLVAYPFITDEIEYINWEWSYREILMVLYALKEFGAFKSETEDIDMSNLKDLIFRCGFFHHGKIDIENSYRDTQTAWNRVFNRQMPHYDENGDEIDNSIMSASENAAFERLQSFSNEVQSAINQYNSHNLP